MILFDEIEKAHHGVFNVLLQILDDGRVTDSQGRTVDFKNTVIIMTSNIGSPHLLEGVTPSGEITEPARQAVIRELRAHFRPKFLNREDDIVLFKPLTLPEIERIVYGARPLKRFIQHKLESRITCALIASQVTEGSVVRVDFRNGALALDIEAPMTREAEVGVGA